jgi:hypothetical protein
MAMEQAKETNSMTPRPLIRWKSFWLGILALGFLGVAWVRSGGYNDAVGFNVVDRYWEVGQDSGMFLIGAVRDEGASPSINFVSTKRPEVVRSFPKGILWEHTNGGPEGVYAFVAHWFLILLFAIPWSAFLAWRWHRQKKLSL